MPPGTLQKRCLEAISPLLPPGCTALVMLVVPNDVRGQDVHVATSGGNVDALAFGCIEWVKARAQDRDTWRKAEGLPE